MTREKTDYIMTEISGWTSNILIFAVLSPFFLLCFIVELLGLEELFS